MVQLYCQVPDDQKMAKEERVSQLVLVVKQLQCQVPEDQKMAKEKRVSQLVLAVERGAVECGESGMSLVAQSRWSEGFQMMFD